MGGLTTPKGGATTTSTQQQTVPGYVSSAQQNLLSGANTVLSPWIQSSAYTSAPINADQSGAYDLTRSLATNAFSSMAGQPSFDAAAYLRQNPDVQQVAQQQGIDPTAYAWQHYSTYGKGEGRAEPMTAGTPATNPIPNPTINTAGLTAPASASTYSASTYNPSNYTASTYDPSMASAAQVSGDDISKLLNPYTNDVVNTTLNTMNQQFGQQQAANAAKYAAAGAFGGSRQAVQSALSQQNQNQQIASTTAQLMAAGFDKATATAMSNAQMQQQTNQGNQAATNTASQFNAGAQNTAGQFNASANQSAAAANAAATNTAGQFNAGAQNTRDQFNAGQTSTANQQQMALAQLQDSLRTNDQARQISALQQLLGIGNAQQATVQNNLNVPLQYLQALAGVTPQQYGGTTTSTAPNTAASPLQTLLGGGLSLLGMGTGGGNTVFGNLLK